jgi:hypothetical protein
VRAHSILVGFAVSLAAPIAFAQAVPVPAPTTSSTSGTTPPAPGKMTITVGDFELSPELQVRTRGEYRRNPVDMGGEGSGFYTEDPWSVMERTRIGLGADRGPLRAKVTFQDARVWGSTPPTATFGDSSFATTGVYEAFIEVHTTNVATPSSASTNPSAPEPQYVRVGRQTIVWDGGRLLGNADFSPVARTLDAVRGHIGWRSLDFEAFGAILDEAQPIGIGFGDPTGPYSGGSQLYGALASLTLDPLFRAQVYGLFRPRTGALTTDTLPTSAFALSRAIGDDWTVALGLGGDSKGWKYGVTGALQLGHIDPNVDRLAYAVVGDASRRFDGIVLTPTVKVGAGYASGADGSTTQYHQFDPLYPDVQVNHGLLGAFAWSNIIDVHGAVSVVPIADLRVTAEYRYARMANKVGDWLDTYLVRAGTNASSEELGHEVDLVVSYRPWPALDVSAGYALLILGDGAKSMMLAENRGTTNSSGTFVAPDLSHYAFLQLTLNVPAR